VFPAEAAFRHCVARNCRFTDQLPEWRLVEGHHIVKTFLFEDFKMALDYVNRIGAVAEEQGHHPDLCLAWGTVEVKIFTHKIRGLSESDFILAAKIDRLYFQNPAKS
jgi:4a-hydroxytetrahydrobiopterin dehydratase